MVAIWTSFVITGLMIGTIFVYGKRRTVGRPTSWGEAMIGSVFIFMLFVMVFGVLPDRWIKYTDNELGWSVENFLFTEGQWVDGDPFTFPPFRMDKKKLSDIIVVVEHLVALAAVPFVVFWWQKRGKAGPVAEPISDFGRPLVKGG